MGKYRGADGWINDESEERPRRYEASDRVNEEKKKAKDASAGVCGATFLLVAGSGLVLTLCLALGAVRKLFSWLWG